MWTLTKVERNAKLIIENISTDELMREMADLILYARHGLCLRVKKYSTLKEGTTKCVFDYDFDGERVTYIFERSDEA